LSRKISLYLNDILDSINNARQFIGAMDYEAFLADVKTCLRRGEVSRNNRRGREEYTHRRQKQYPGIPWKQMAGMRDKVIHSYFGVNFERVWLVVQDGFPAIEPLLEEARERLLKEEEMRG